MYNKQHQEKIAGNTQLPNNGGKVWEEITLAETEINISGKSVKF